MAVLLVRYLGLILCALIVWHVTLTHLISYQQAKNQQLHLFLEKRKTEVMFFNKQQKENVEFASRLEFIKQLHNKNERTTTFLAALPTLFSSGIALSQLKRTGEEIIINGSADSNTDLLHFMQSITQSSVMKTPLMISVDAKDEMRYFQLKTGIK